MSGLPPTTDEPAGYDPTPGQPRPPAADPPADFGQYRLLDRLGRGGMGTVYRAQHLRLKRTVAIKFLHNPEPGRHCFERFLKEMEALGRLEHPHVVRASDAGDWAGRPFLVLEHLDGADLRHIVHTAGTLDVADACEVMRQAALGLQYAHDMKLVHRDLKPSNLFLTCDGCVKILDLGLVRLGESDNNPLTQPGELIGTLDYMAPEQAVDPHTADVRSDLYALGCTFYYLLTGFPPFCGPEYRTRDQKLEAHAKKKPRPLQDYRPDVPLALTPVLNRLLEKSPTDRYAAPRELAEALQSFAVRANLKKLATECRPPATQPATPLNAAQPTRKGAMLSGEATLLERPRQRRNAWTFALALGTLVLVIALVLFAGSGRQPNAESTMPISSKGPRELLTSEPITLWKAHNDAPPWIYNPQTHTLDVHAVNLCLLQLGQADTANYALDVAYTLNAAEGELGLFLGYRREQQDGKDYGRFLRLVQHLAPAKTVMEFSPMRVNQHNGNLNVWDTLVQRSLPPTARGRHQMGVRIEKGRITRLYFDELNLASRLAVEQQPANEDLLGPFGLCSSRGWLTLHSFVYTPLDEEP